MGVRDDVRRAMEGLGVICETVIRQTMDSPIGINPRVGLPTLVDSNLSRTMTSNFAARQSAIEILAEDYWKYVEGGVGGKRQTGKGHWVPDKYLLPWMASRGIPNDALRRIQGRIFWDGIAPRPVFSSADLDGDPLIQDAWDEVFDALTNETTKFFEN